MKVLSPRISVYSRSKGHSMVAASAYRSGQTLWQAERAHTHHYGHRQDDVVHAEIIAPELPSLPAWVMQRERLWNEAEAVENRMNSCLGRETMLPLPHELNDQQRLELVQNYAQWIANRQQVMVDFAIHRPSKTSDERNHHAHILMSARQITPDGFRNKKSFRDENGKTIRYIPFDESKQRGSEEVEAFRQAAQAFTNQALAAAGSTERVDNRSYQRQGLSQRPTIHLGKEATQLERQGLSTERTHYNQSITLFNRVVSSAQSHVTNPKYKTQSLYEDMFEKLRMDEHKARINITQQEQNYGHRQ